MLRKLRLGPHHVGSSLDEGESLSFEKFLRAGFSVELFQFRLVVEELQLARGTDHVEVDDTFHFRIVMRHDLTERIVGLVLRGAESGSVSELVGEKKSTHSCGAGFQKLSASISLKLAAPKFVEKSFGIHGKVPLRGVERWESKRWKVIS